MRHHHHSYSILRTHAANAEALRALVYGDEDDAISDALAEEPRCRCCGVWIGHHEDAALCDWCRYDEADRC